MKTVLFNIIFLIIVVTLNLTGCGVGGENAPEVVSDIDGVWKQVGETVYVTPLLSEVTFKNGSFNSSEKINCSPYLSLAELAVCVTKPPEYNTKTGQFVIDGNSLTFKNIRSQYRDQISGISDTTCFFTVNNSVLTITNNYNSPITATFIKQ